MAEAARAEFAALRDELKTRQQASHSAIGIGLTAAAAIAGFAVGKEDGDRLELLLVLPVVLTGLGAFYLENSRACYVIGAYVNDYVWPRMHAGMPTPEVSWEKYINNNRRDVTGAIVGILPGLLIFFAPSAAALLANADGPLLEPATWPSDRLAAGLDALWYVDLVALVALTVLVPVVFLGRPSLTRGAT